MNETPIIDQGADVPLAQASAPKFTTTDNDEDVIERDVVMHLDPRQLAPHGDRYIVLKMRIADKIKVSTVNGPKILYTSANDEEDHGGFYFAKIIAKGTGHRLEANTIVPMPFEPDEIVMVEKYSGKQYIIGSKTYCTVNQVDILTAVPELSPERQYAPGRFAMTDSNELVQI